MNLKIITIKEKLIINKDNKFSYIKNSIIEKKKKYGIPLLSIIGDEITKEENIENNESFNYSEDKLISLTFDDGPTEYTNKLLETLNKYDSRATFFILGNNIYNNEDIIKNIHSFGNEIGIHGYSHIPFTNMDIDDINVEIATTYDILDSLGVNPTNIVRPPFGKLNETIKEQVKSPFVLWNIDTGDAKINNKDMIKNKIIDNIEPGSIIKMHDTSALTIDVLESVLPILKNMGYKVVTVSEMNKRYSNELIPGRVYAKIKDYAA